MKKIDQLRIACIAIIGSTFLVPPFEIKGNRGEIFGCGLGTLFEWQIYNGLPCVIDADAWLVMLLCAVAIAFLIYFFWIKDEQSKTKPPPSS